MFLSDLKLHVVLVCIVRLKETIPYIQLTTTFSTLSVPLTVCNIHEQPYISPKHIHTRANHPGTTVNMSPLPHRSQDPQSYQLFSSAYFLPIHILLLPTIATITYLILNLHQWRLTYTEHSPKLINTITIRIFMCFFIATAMLFLEPITGPVIDDASASWLRFWTFEMQTWSRFWGVLEGCLEEGWKWGLDFVDLGREGTVRVVVVARDVLESWK